MKETMDLPVGGIYAILDSIAEKYVAVFSARSQRDAERFVLVNFSHQKNPYVLQGLFLVSLMDITESGNKAAPVVASVGNLLEAVEPPQS